MVAFCTLTMMAALFGTAAAQIEIDSTSMTLVETLSPSHCRHLNLKWIHLLGHQDETLVGDMRMDMETSRCTETSETPDTVRMVRMVPS
jgi:hypothetical protein